MIRQLTLAGGLALALFGVAAAHCPKPGHPQFTPQAYMGGGMAAPAPRVHTVVIDNLAYGPPVAAVRAGDVVVWVNRDRTRHSATARDMSFDVDLAPGQSARVVVGRPGVIDYFCRYHPQMAGRLLIAG